MDIRTLIIYTTSVDSKREMDEEAKGMAHEDTTAERDMDKDKNR